MRSCDWLTVTVGADSRPMAHVHLCGIAQCTDASATTHRETSERICGCLQVFSDVAVDAKAAEFDDSKSSIKHNTACDR